MIEDIGYIEPVLLIKPEKFSIENIEQYELHIEIGTTFFRFAIKDQDIFISLEDFQYPLDQTKTEFIKAIFNEHPYLSARFWNNIKVILHSTKKTVVPAKLDIEQANQVWEALYGKPEANTSILYTSIGKNSVVFQTNTEQLDFLFGFYSDKKIIITLAESLLPITENQETYLLFDGKGCHITYSKPQLNCYYASDWRKLDKNRNDQNLLLIGEITEYATEFKQLTNEIIHAKKASLKPSIRLSSDFSQIAHFRYFIILNS
ncbi:DUF3822 family protein [Arcticibacterium luteifluviistationis]|uniref:DUF3822 family protein n=1 Tax=Arcticibacterium luteifluviistationis TaxID=1784714 RepID=UPI0013A69B01|nr:DUF3822 family protein [Arcticibacterium luteifluviistationis]